MSIACYIRAVVNGDGSFGGAGDVLVARNTSRSVRWSLWPYSRTTGYCRSELRQTKYANIYCPPTRHWNYRKNRSFVSHCERCFSSLAARPLEFAIIAKLSRRRKRSESVRVSYRSRYISFWPFSLSAGQDYTHTLVWMDVLRGKSKFHIIIFYVLHHNNIIIFISYTIMLNSFIDSIHKNQL